MIRLLLDQNLSYKLCPRLKDIYSDSAHVRAVGLAEADDQAVWSFARANDYVLVTQDSDFAGFVSLYGPPPKVVWLRCGNASSAQIESLLRANVDRIEDLVAGADVGLLEILSDATGL